MQKIRLYLIGVAAAVLLGPVESSFSQCPESEPEGEFKDIPVEITFDDNVGDGVHSDGGLYRDSRQNKITANVGRNRSIVLDVGEASGRMLSLDLSEALTCACSTKIDIDDDDTCDDPTVCLIDVPFVNPNLGDVHFIISLGEDLDDLALGCTHEDNAKLSFTVGEDNWVLRWGPYESAGGPGFCPGSGHMTVTRTDDNTWDFTTTGSHLACLYRQQNPPHMATEYHGQFIVPFSGAATALNMDQIANLPPCIPQDCRDRRNRLAVPTSCDLIGPCGTCAVPADCDDADPCTIDDCVGGVCVNDPIDCDDGNACTADTCSGGVCFNDPIDCNDGDACSEDTCDPGSGCVNAFPDCGLLDDCCGPSCSPANDPDCPSCGAKHDPCTVDEDCCSLNCLPSGKCSG